MHARDGDDAESRDTVKVGIGLIATMTALDFGPCHRLRQELLRCCELAVNQHAIEILTLDRVLARYGSETKRADLIRSIRGQAEAERLAEAIRGLKPRDEAQRSLQSRAMDLAEALLPTRWLILTGTEMLSSSAVPCNHGVLATITLASFGLSAPRNATVLTALFVCAVSVASAVFLVLEMDRPFDGSIRVSGARWRNAHAQSVGASLRSSGFKGRIGVDSASGTGGRSGARRA